MPKSHPVEFTIVAGKKSITRKIPGPTQKEWAEYRKNRPSPVFDYKTKILRCIRAGFRWCEDNFRILRKAAKQLDPCPFCGCTFIDIHPQPAGRTQIVCQQCMAQRSVLTSDIRQVIAEWNTRAK